MNETTPGSDPLPARLRPLRPTDPPVLGSWQLLGRLGAGGMGTTYLAHDATGNRAAVKVLRDDLAENHEFRARFARELDVLRTLDTSHTAAVLGADLDADVPYLLLEYLAGPTLAEQVDTHGPLSEQQVHDLAADLAEALATVHRADIVHRDVKPANVILTDHGAKLIDFGVASALEATSLTRTGVLVGSPGWLSPEQLTGQHVGPPADVFGWAAVVTYAATGRSPFGHGRPERTMYAVLSQEPDLAAVSTSMKAPLRLALAKDPAVRPSATDLLADLHGDHTTITDAAGGPQLPLRVPKRLRPGAVAASVTVLVALAGGAGYASLYGGEPNDLHGSQAASSAQTTDRPSPQAETPPPFAAPQITLDCSPQADPSSPGRVLFDHTHQADTEDFSVHIEYGDGLSYTASSSSNNVDSAFWHDYQDPGHYGPVTATITDATGQAATATCSSVYVPTGLSEVTPTPQPATTDWYAEGVSDCQGAQQTSTYEDYWSHYDQAQNETPGYFEGWVDAGCAMHG